VNFISIPRGGGFAGAEKEEADLVSLPQKPLGGKARLLFRRGNGGGELSDRKKALRIKRVNKKKREASGIL